MPATKENGEPPKVRSRNADMQRRANRTGKVPHALPSIDMAWHGAGERDGWVELAFDGRDFSGLEVSTEWDDVLERWKIYVRPDTVPRTKDDETDPITGV